jgi:glycosyltransferase involved in cell wall biosynthesis
MQGLALPKTCWMPPPLLSIGMPVYNGAETIEESLKSLLAQEVADFELIICDDASTDRTLEICRRYAAQDRRIEIVANRHNVGSARNFNAAFSRARGRYFMWAAQDDRWHPRYARACIAELERHPRAVACASQIAFLGPYDVVIAVDANIDTEGLDVVGRLRAVFERVGWYALYGVMRPEAVRATGGYAAAFGGDVIFMLEMLLLGEFITVKERLFGYRYPAAEKSPDHYTVVVDPTRRTSPRPYTSLARELFARVRRALGATAAWSAVREEIIRILALQNRDWRRRMLAEHGYAGHAEPEPEIALRLVREFLGDSEGDDRR